MSSLNRMPEEIQGNRFPEATVGDREPGFVQDSPADKYYQDQLAVARRLLGRIMAREQEESSSEFTGTREALQVATRRLRMLARMADLTRPGSGPDRFSKVLGLGLSWYVLTRITKVVDLGLDPRERRPLPHSFLRPGPVRMARAVSGFSLADFSSPERTGSLFRALFPKSLWDENLYHWLRSHLEVYLINIPDQFARGESFGKLVRCMLGTVFFRTTTFQKRNMGPRDLKKEVYLGFRLGFWYGVTYLFDDIMDADYYSGNDKRKIFNYLEAYLSGRESGLPILDKDPALAEYLFSAPAALGELMPERREMIFNAFYALLRAQLKEGGAPGRTAFHWNEHGPLLMVKAAGTRIIAALLAGLPVDQEYNQHALASGLAIQLMDDLRDLGPDLAAGTRTPFTALVTRGTDKGEAHPLRMCCAAMAHVSGRLGHPQKALEAWAYKLAFSLRTWALAMGGEPETAFALTTGLPALDRALVRATRAPAGINMSELIIRETSRAGVKARKSLLEKKPSRE